MPKNTPLGNEWGALAGLDPEVAARRLAAYAKELEDRIEQRTTGAADDEDEDANPNTDLDTARNLHGRSVQPVATEFVGQREAAKSKARQNIRGQGFEWEQYGDYVEQAMANATPDQQTNANAWTEAWWYVWGTAKRAEELARRAQPEDERPAQPATPPRSETRVEQGAMTADRSNGRGSRTAPRQWDIPEDERATKRKFERHLGIKMSDEEWVRLQSEEDPIQTAEQYDALQERLTAGARR